VATGQGGLLNVIGAVQKAGTAYNTFKGKNLQSIVREEANAAVKGVLRDTLPGAVRAQPVSGGPSVQQRLNAPIFPTPPKK
jgi:hypothetical protein